MKMISAGFSLFPAICNPTRPPFAPHLPNRLTLALPHPDHQVNSADYL
jgi:hypothetical protein